jgi:DNA anti-recombination protein RmuC
MEGYEKAVMTPVESVGGLVKAFQDNVGTTVTTLHQDIDTIAKGTQDRLTAFDSNIKDIRVEVEKIANETGKFEQLNSMTKQVHDIFVGAPTKGKAGEEVLNKSLDTLVEMQLVKKKVLLGGGVVEFAIAFSDKKFMPIDSTVRCTKELNALSDAGTNDEQRMEFAKTVKKEIQAKVDDVQKYIMPPTTVEQAIVAVPDGAMNYVSEVTADALNKGVFLIRYSALAPFVKMVSYVYSLYVVRGDITTLQEKLSRVEHEMSGLDNHFFSTNFDKPLGKMRDGINTIKEAVRAMNSTLALQGEQRKSLTGLGNDQKETHETSQTKL